MSQSSKIHSIIDYTRENCHENLNLDVLSRKFDICYFYICKLFRSVINKTFRIFLQQCRVEKAKILLAEKKYLMKEVQYMSGFQSRARFNRVFKSYTGVNPSQFRKKFI